MYSKYEEMKWINEAKDGGAMSFIRLVEPYQNELVNTVHILLPAEVDSEDTMIEILAEAYSSLGAYSSSIGFRKWLFKNLIKAVNDLNWELIGGLEFNIYAGTSCSTIRIYNRDSKHRYREVILSTTLEDKIRDAIMALPWDERVALVLCDLLAFNYSDIAYIIETTIHEVAASIFNARENLISRLD